MASILLGGLKPDDVDPAQLEQVRALAPNVRIVVTEQRAEMEAALDDVEIASGFIPPDLIVRAPHLRWYQQWGAGADWLLRHPEAAAKDFLLTNVSGIHAIPISEHILALLLAFARRLPPSIRAQEQHRWQALREQSGVFELAGQTLLLIGTGAIGRRTAKIAAAMGMRVLGIRRNPTEGVQGIEKMGGRQDLHHLLSEADFVVLTVPLTAETKEMMGPDEFGLMKRTAYLVNIGRGGTVDEDALVQALMQGEIAGAGLDVFKTEPLAADSPLWDMDNVVITAHYAGMTPHYSERAMAIFLDNLQRYQAGEPLLHIVDKDLGY